MITTQRYFIHVDNKSVVPWTSEVEGNYKFKEITAKVAMAIEHGKISADKVVEQVMRQIKPATLEQMLDAKLKMNVREGELNLESQIREDNTQHDTGEAKPFEVNIPGEDGGAPSGDAPSGDAPSGEDAPKDGAKKPTGKAGGKTAGKSAGKAAGGKTAKDKPSAPPAEAPAADDAPGAEAPADDAAKVAAALDGDGDGEQAAGGVNV